MCMNAGNNVDERGQKGNPGYAIGISVNRDNPSEASLT